MIFESLADRLQETFKKLRGHGKLTADDVNATMREIRIALLEADVNFKVVKDFIKKIKERAVGQEVLESLTHGSYGTDPEPYQYLAEAAYDYHDGRSSGGR